MFSTKIDLSSLARELFVRHVRRLLLDTCLDTFNRLSL